MKNVKIVYKNIDHLRPYEGNARVHSEQQIAQIATSIREFGFVNPVLVDNDLTVIAGHGRILAAVQLGMKEVPVVIVGNLSERQRKALTIADNQIALNSTWDIEKLSAELSSLAEANFDLSLVGFNEQELDNLLRDDSSLLPSWDQHLFPKDEETSEEKSTPSAVRGPRGSDDGYGVFELVMQHENKQRLVNVLHSIRTAKGFDKTEDALMEMVRKYEENK